MKPKIEKQKTSLHWILIHLANAFGLKQNGLYNREDYNFKKIHILMALDNFWIGNQAKLIQNSIFSLKYDEMSPKSPTYTLFLSTSFWS